MDCDFGWIKELLFDLLPGHEWKSGENSVVDQLLVSHNVTCIECGDGVDKQIVGFFEIPDQQKIQGFVDFESVLSLPISSLLKQVLAFVDDLFDFGEISLF